MGRFGHKPRASPDSNVAERTPFNRAAAAYAMQLLKTPSTTLRLLAETDKRVVNGFWSVAKEAADAIEKIEGGNSSHARKKGCIFCVRE